MADEIAEIADNTQSGEIVTEKDAFFEGKRILDAAGKPIRTIESKRSDMLEHRKLRIDARKWLAAKLLPKVYGDKLDVNVSGELQLAERISKARKRNEP